MHKADVCINHAIGTKYGTHTVQMQRYLRKMAFIPKGKNSRSFDKLLSYLEPPTDNDDPVETFFAGNVQRHGTLIASFVKDSKRYVWYNNPWGFDADLEYHQGEEGMEWSEDFKDNTVQDLKRQNLTVPKVGTETHSYNYSELYFLNAHRVTQFIDYSISADQRREVMSKFHLWNKPRIPTVHPMSVMYFLKILFNADHLVILHPIDTMPLHGPQTSDGVDQDLPNIGSRGACSLWLSMYAAKVHDVIGTRLSNTMNPVNTLLRHVKTTLASESLHGKVENDWEKRSAIARGVDDREYSLKALLALVYDVIPEKNSFRKRKRTHLSTSWHDRVFRKLDTLLVIEEREYEKVRGKKENSEPDGGVTVLDHFKVNAEEEDVIIAGYIETLAIISNEDETNSGLTYLDKTGHVAAFVARNRLHSLHFLMDFVDATKFLISCKHNDDPEIGASRRTYDLLSGTRLVKERHDRILRDTHPKLFGYSLADRQRKIENSLV